MHELATTRALLALVLDAAAGRPVSAVHLVIGELTSMMDDSVQFYFDVLSRDTVAAGARLCIERERAIGTCRACGHAAPVSIPFAPACAQCGALQVAVQGGQSFYIDSIEVADESAGRNAGVEGQRSGRG